MPGDGFFPIIRQAGFEGFVYPGIDGGRLRVVAQISNENGAALAAPTTVVGRFNSGPDLWSAGWGGGGVFAFRDDGTNGDTVAGDGWWTSDLTVVPSAPLLSASLLIEVMATCSPPGGGIRVSDIWPRVTVH